MSDAREGSGRDRRALVEGGLVVLWGIALVAGFVLEHSSLSLASSAAEAPTDGPGALAAILAALRSLVAATSILGAAMGYGGLVVRLGFGSLGFGRVADRCGELMLGGGVMAIAVFGLGHAHLLKTIPSFLLVGIGLAALGFGRLKVADTPAPRLERARHALRFDPIAALAFTGVAIAFLLAFVIALAPPTARDALVYHLATPKAYVVANGIIETPWNVLSYSPFATEMLFTLGLVVGPDTTTNLVHLGFGVALVVFVFVVGRRTTDSVRWAAVASVIVASVPSVIWNAGIAHNEMWLGLALTIACLSIGKWFETREDRLLLWCGAAMGVALSGKHTAMLLAPILALVVLLRVRSLERSEQNRTLRMAVVAGLVAIVFPLPWYVQNVARTQNPLYPFFWNLFPTQSSVWEATRAEYLEQYVRQSYGQPGGFATWLWLPWDVSIRAQNDVAPLFDGVLGPVFLFLAPQIAIVILRSATPTWLRVATIVAASFLVIWATQSQQIRFLLPVLPVIALAGATSLASMREVWPRWALGLTLAVMLALNLAVATAEVAWTAPQRPVFGLESRDSYLTRRLPYYSFYIRLNRELGPSQRVLLVNMRNDGYYLDVPYVSDSVFEDFTVGRIVNEAATASDVRAGIERLGATHILAREDILYDPRFSPFNDEAATSRWSTFLQSSTNRLESRDGMSLYALKERNTK